MPADLLRLCAPNLCKKFGDAFAVLAAAASPAAIGASVEMMSGDIWIPVPTAAATSGDVLNPLPGVLCIDTLKGAGKIGLTFGVIPEAKSSAAISPALFAPR